jgi:hypothetical protein
MLEEYIVLTPGIVHVKLSIMTYGWFMKIYKLLQLKDYTIYHNNIISV